jgi:hypothetical protein
MGDMTTSIGTDVLDGITDYVRRNDYVTYVEIERHLKGRNVPVEGDRAICLSDDPNIILWAGMSEEFTEIMHAMMREKRIFPHPAAHLVYLIDGKTLRFPLAQRMPKGGYKKPHWAPICFRCTPYEKSGRKRRTA